MQKYEDGTLKKEDIEKLISHLQYQTVQDYKDTQILMFLNIPNICFISNFKTQQHQSSNKEPYFKAICYAFSFDKQPRMPKPSCRVYTKPIQLVALPALATKANVN